MLTRKLLPIFILFWNFTFLFAHETETDTTRELGSFLWINRGFTMFFSKPLIQTSFSINVGITDKSYLQFFTIDGQVDDNDEPNLSLTNFGLCYGAKNSGRWGLAAAGVGLSYIDYKETGSDIDVPTQIFRDFEEFGVVGNIQLFARFYYLLGLGFDYHYQLFDGYNSYGAKLSFQLWI